jgi:hypothetical protein
LFVTPQRTACTWQPELARPFLQFWDLARVALE